MAQGLLHVERTETTRFGKPTWVLVGPEGEVAAFTYFCRRNESYAYATQKRYAEVVSRFIDFLIRVGVLGGATSRQRVNAAIEGYLALLAMGSQKLVEKLRQEDDPATGWLIPFLENAREKALAPQSFDNTIAALNRFLRLSEALAQEAFERADALGLQCDGKFTRLIEALDGCEALTRSEVRSLKENSVFGSVIRLRGELRRPRGVKAPGRRSSKQEMPMHFPLEHLPALIRAATSWRDRAFWLLLAASGIRTSEALNLRWVDIDIANLKVRVVDPADSVAHSENSPEERFKGRVTEATYLLQGLRVTFFDALAEYLKAEYLPVKGGSRNDLVFQYVDPRRRGLSYRDASDAAIAKSFRKAVRRAAIPGKAHRRSSNWTPHSLRHSYGYYMHNEFPVDPENGIYGLSLNEVQLLMGHRDARTTSKYAKRNIEKLHTQLEDCDRRLLTTKALGSK